MLSTPSKVREEIQSFDWKANIYGTASSIVLATLAILFFRQIIPLNPFAAALTAGSGCIALMVINVCFVFSLKNVKSGQKNLREEASKDPIILVKKDPIIERTDILQLNNKLKSAVRAGEASDVENILNGVISKEDLLSLLSEYDISYSALHLAVVWKRLEIVKLIIKSAIRFNVLDNILFYNDRQARVCSCLPNYPETTEYIFKILKEHPVPLALVLDWREPVTGHSLFQITVREESKSGSNALTTAILEAAKTIGRCMSTIMFKDEDGKSCFDMMGFNGALVIQAIMNAAETTDNQLQVIELAKDKDGRHLVKGEGCKEIRKYELFCYAVKGNKNAMEGILRIDFRRKKFLENGVLAQARDLAKENQHKDIVEYLNGILN